MDALLPKLGHLIDALTFLVVMCGFSITWKSL
jgi:hypothetical protein